MKKRIQVLTAGLLVATLVLAPAVGMAQDKPKTPPAGNAAEKPVSPATRAVPFRGTVAAVDKTAKTVKIGERVFHISAETKLIKGNQAGTIEDIKVGDAVSGNYTKGEDGKLTAKMVRYGPKSAADPSDK